MEQKGLGQESIKKHIAIIAVLFMAISAMLFSMPQKAAAATPTVKIGGVDISGYAGSDWQNNRSIISGWNAGRFKLSSDRKTLYLDGFKYSGSEYGITSTDALTINVSGYNEFECSEHNGIDLEDSGGNKDLTVTSDPSDSSSSDSLHILCSEINSTAVTVGSLIKTAPDLFDVYGYVDCDENLIVSKGNIIVRGSLCPQKKAVISGGVITVTESYGPGKIELSGGLFNAGKTMYARGMTIEGGQLSVGAKETVVTGDLSVSGGKLICNNTNCYYGIYVNGNASISGTGVVGAKTSNSTAFNVQGMLTVSGGSVEATTSYDPNNGNNSYPALKAKNMTISGGTMTSSSSHGTGIFCNGSVTATGGTMTGTSDDNNGIEFGDSSLVKISGNAKLEGTTKSTDWKSGVKSNGNITMTGGKLTGTSATGYGINVNSLSSQSTVNGNLNVSGTAEVVGITPAGLGISAVTITADGGTVTGNITGGEGAGSSSGISCNYINLSGTADVTGSVTGTGTTGSSYSTGVSVTETITVDGGSLKGISTLAGNRGNGLHTGALILRAGTVSTEMQSAGYVYGYPSNPSLYADSLEMTGGKLIGKVDSEGRTAFSVSKSNETIADDIWLSQPSDGYMDYFNDIWLRQKKADGSVANEAVLQKVKSISVKEPPSGVFYEGDAFDPAGLVLTVKFEDGQTADLSYNEHHADMFSFSVSENTSLRPGDQTILISCLSKTAQTNINVKELGAAELSGTAGDSSNTLEWSSVPGADLYQVYSGKVDGRISLIAEQTGTGFVHDGLSHGETRDYYVVAIRQGTAGGETSGEQSNIVRLTTGIDPPVIQLSGSTYDSLSLSWDASEGATMYDVYRSEAGGGSSFIDRTIHTNYTDSGLVTGCECTYYVKAVIHDKNIYSRASNEVSATPAFTGKTTLSLEGDGPYTIKWDAVDGATGYEVMRGTGANGSRALLASVDSADTTTYADDSADIYTAYNYSVVPVRTVEGNTFRGQDSNAVVTTAKDKPAPPAPAIKPPATDDPKGTAFNLLQARAGKVTKNSVQIKWKTVNGAKEYVVYGNKCGKNYKYKKLTTTAKNTVTYKNIAGQKFTKGTYYKFIVYAVGSDGKTISTSKTVHVVTAGGKYGNDKKVTTAAKKNAVALKKGKTFKLKAKAVRASKKKKVQKHRGIAYETSNGKVATVTSKGVIKAAGKGVCYVYAYTQNGIFCRVKVTVK